MTTVEPIRQKKDIKKVEKILLKQNYRNFLLFKMGINSGLRISDILSLNIEDVRGKNFINIIEQKTGKRKKIPINDSMKTLLKPFIKNKKGKEPLFKSLASDSRLDRINAYKIIKSACKEASIESRIGTHTLRKTFGYHHYKKFKDIVLLQKIFNHSNPEITLRYICVCEDEIYNSYMNFVL